MAAGVPVVVEGLVSTIIPVWNRAGMVSQALDSVLAQTHRPIEVLAVDDGSTDATPEILAACAREHPSIVRVVRTERQGPGRARETGRQRARGEFLQYLDSDDWLLPEKFSSQVKLLRDHPDCGIAYGLTRVVDTAGREFLADGKWTDRKQDFLFPRLLVERWWHTSTPLYRRSVSDAAGPWPAQRPEDWDLEARMGAQRVKLAYSPAPVSCHRHHDDPGRVTSGSQEPYLREQAWFLPRLHACAIRAGVPVGGPEMMHFSRRAFLRARQLGALGESAMARTLFALAVEAAGGPTSKMRQVGLLASVLGWRVTGRLCQAVDRIAGSPVESSQVVG